METRFGVKDFFLFLLVAALTVLVVLAMVQFDRQWDDVQKIKSLVEDQGRELARMSAVLAAGGAGGAVRIPATGPSARDDHGDDPFARIRAARARSDFAEGDWLVDGFGGKVAKLTPLISRDAYASVIQSYILEPLATRDPDTLEYRGRIARSWQISADGMTITFQLRDYVRFSDGEPLTADDVVFTFSFIMDERIACPRHRTYYRTMESVRKTGPHEVVFRFKEPYFEAFALAASLAVLPKHYYSRFEPEAFNASTGLLMGSGPYVLDVADPAGWKPGMPIQLKRNVRYWGVPCAFERLQFIEYTNEVARLTAFRNGTIDVFGALPEQYVDMLKDSAILQRTQRFEYQNPVGGYRYIAWAQRRNNQPTFFADRRVRQAMTMLIDRRRMIEEVMLGYAVEATGPFNPLSRQCSPNVKPWPFDIERAKALLAEAGFRPGAGGVLISQDGKPFEFSLTYPSGTGNYDRMALFVKDALARAGIVCKPDPLEWSTFSDRLRNKNFEAISLGWTSDIEIDIYQMFHSSSMEAGGDNFVSYSNPELDAAMEKARRTVDESARMPLWNRCHEILHEDQPYTFLFFGKSLVFIDKRIHNVVMTRRMGLNGRSEWYVPKHLQRWK